MTARGRLLAVFGLALLISPAALHGQGKPAEVLRIGSWNIEHLGDPVSRRGSGENVQQKPEDLARYIRYARVDVLALQEIKADAEAPAGFPKKFRTNSILNKTFAELNKTPGNNWKHVLFPKSTGDNRQWTGVAWKESKVKPVGDIFQVPVSHAVSKQGNKLWDRNVHAIKFSAGKDKTDFLILVLHLKANTFENFAGQREEELKDLAAKFPLLEKAFPGEQDIVILGDTNMLDEKESKVKEMGVVVLEGKGFRDLNRNDDTHFAKGTQPFSRVFVPLKQPEFKASRLEVLSEFRAKEKMSFNEFRERYSDHYMVVTEIRVMADDD